MKRRRFLGRRLATSAGFFWIVSLLPAQAPPGAGIPPASWDAACPTLSFPAWFGPVQSFATAQTTLWRASVRPPPGPSQLAATFVFEEKETGVARLIWQGSGRSVVLSPNLFEGAARLHQRTLLIDRMTLGGAGQLVLESTGNIPVLVRAELSWVEPLVLADSGWTPPGLFLAPSGKILPSEELEGQTNLRPEDFSRNRLVDAVLDPGPVRCPPHTPVRFLSTLTLEPAHGRVQARIAGLRPGEEPEVWVNGWRLPAVALEVPGLDDPGYRWENQGADQASAYGGWRTAVAYLPPGWLRRGENHVDWVCPAGSSAMTLRNIRMQVSYDTPPSAGKLAVPPQPISTSVSVNSVPPVTTVSPKLRLGLSSSSTGIKLRQE